MTSKRGQVTLFVILAIIVVALGLTAYFIFKPQAQNTQEQVTSLKTYLSDAISAQIHKNIIKVMQQGGYAFAPLDSFETPYYNVAYWITGNETNYPSLEEVAFNIDLLNFGIGQTNLTPLFSDYEISQGTFESNTTILENTVQVSAKWPITIKKNQVTQTIEDFDFNYDIRLKKLYGVSVYAADLVANDSLPTELPQDMNLTIYVYYNASLYEIQDTNINYQLDQQPYNLVFAVR